MMMDVRHWTSSEVQRHLSREKWADANLLRNLNEHEIDGAALLELTKEDLRYDFGIQELGRIKTVLRGIESLTKRRASDAMTAQGALSSCGGGVETRADTTTDFDEEVRAVLMRGMRATTPDAYYRPTSSVLKDNIPRACSSLAGIVVRALPAWADLNPPPLTTADANDATRDVSEVDSNGVALVHEPTAGVVGILEAERRKERIGEVVAMLGADTPRATPDLPAQPADTQPIPARAFQEALWDATAQLDAVSFDHYMSQCTQGKEDLGRREEIARKSGVARGLYAAWRETTLGSGIAPDDVVRGMEMTGVHVTPGFRPQEPDVSEKCFVEAVVRALQDEDAVVYDWKTYRTCLSVQKLHSGVSKLSPHPLTVPSLVSGTYSTQRCLVVNSDRERLLRDPFSTIEAAATKLGVRAVHAWYATPRSPDDAARRKAILDTIRRKGVREGHWCYLAIDPAYMGSERNAAGRLLREVGLVLNTSSASATHPRFRVFVYVAPFSYGTQIPDILSTKSELVDATPVLTAEVGEEK
eukprot:PhM_4_TR3/c0_g1_i1/m.90273